MKLPYASWLYSLVGLLVLILNIPTVVAQTNVTVQAETTGLKYQSVFTHYQSLNDQPVASWRETNDLVAQIGGWRTYAKQARQLDTAETIDKAALVPHSITNSTANPDIKTGVHAGHGAKP